MKLEQLKALGLENKKRSNIIGIFSYTPDAGSPDCRYSIFHAELGKYFDNSRSTSNEEHFIIYGQGQDNNGHFNLTGYDFDNYRHLIKEYHPNSDKKASDIPLIYRYNLSSITPEIIVGKWYWSREPLLPNISKNSIERDTAEFFGEHYVNHYGRFCFTTISDSDIVEFKNAPTPIEIIETGLIKATEYLDKFNKVLQDEHDKESLPFQRITLDKLDF